MTDFKKNFGMKNIELVSELRDLIENWLKSKEKTTFVGEWRKTFEKQNKDFTEKLVKCDDYFDYGALIIPFSWLLVFDFKLEKPYLSKDDTTLHILENPVRKEHVFKVPMIAATQWKGALRAAMTNQLARWWAVQSEESKRERRIIKEFLLRRLQLVRLFGTEKGVDLEGEICEFFLDELDVVDNKHIRRWYRRIVSRYYSRSGFFAGRLFFYPTFFESTSLEVINPHPRETGAGSNPILFESVPTGEKGTFQILYAPMDHLASDKKLLARQVACDLQAVGDGVNFLLTGFGFGAKTSSGYGRASNDLHGNGKLMIYCSLPGEDEKTTEESASEPMQELPRYLEAPGTLVEDFRTEDGRLKSEEEYRKTIEDQGLKYNRKRKQLYDKAKKWWEGEGEEFWKSRHASPDEKQSEPKPEPEPAPSPTFVERSFSSLSELCETAKEIANKIIEHHGK